MESLRTQLQEALGTGVAALSPIAGGDINRAYRARLAEGGDVFVKTHPEPLPGMFLREAEGLRFLDGADAIRIPKVLHACDAGADGPHALLALEYVPHGRPRPGTCEQLGRGIAALHRFGAPRFGLERDNYLATLPQDNRATDDWASFYGERRLRPLLRRAHDAGLAQPALTRSFDALLSRLPTLVGDPEPPARLHGDLWAGNAMTAADGAPVLIDPAVYGGHREVDLAMMALFGGFDGRCLAAYDEVYPRAPGHEARLPLYQLYPLLVHLLLFGAGYHTQLGHALRAALGG